MQNGKDPQAINTIDRILECAVSLNWKDFTSDSVPVAMQMEYHAGPERSLEYLKLWTSNLRGHWKLVCEYWILAEGSHQQGIKFADAYSSPGLARMLDSIMRHQPAFSMARTDLLGGLVQIAPPDEAQSAAARHQMAEALERITARTSHGTVIDSMRSAADHPPISALAFTG